MQRAGATNPTSAVLSRQLRTNSLPRISHRTLHRAPCQGEHHATLRASATSPPMAATRPLRPLQSHKQPRIFETRVSPAAASLASWCHPCLPACRTWMEGLLRCPRLLVVWRGSCPSIIVWGLMRRNASITTLPFTLCTGSTTTATARWFRASKLCTGGSR